MKKLPNKILVERKKIKNRIVDCTTTINQIIDYLAKKEAIRVLKEQSEKSELNAEYEAYHCCNCHRTFFLRESDILNRETERGYFYWYSETELRNIDCPFCGSNIIR